MTKDQLRSDSLQFFCGAWIRLAKVRLPQGTVLAEKASAVRRPASHFLVPGRGGYSFTYRGVCDDVVFASTEERRHSSAHR